MSRPTPMIRLLACMTAALAGGVAGAGFLAATSMPASAQVVPVADYAIQGATVYEPQWLAAFAYQHVAAVDGGVTPDRFADAIELVYREDGYFLAEVEIRQAQSGQLVFVIHEGRIDTVAIEGVDEKLYRRISAYLEPVVGRDAINRKEFERAVALAGDLAGVSVKTEIDYPDAEGGARLRILGETHSQSGRLTIDNPPRRFGKAVTGALTQEFYNTVIGGDLLRLSGDITYSGRDIGEGVSLNGTAYYRAPIGGSGLYFEGYVGNVYSRRDASGALANTELAGFNGGIVLGSPWLRDFHQYGYFLVEARHTEVNSVGGGLNFTSSVNAASGMLLYGYDVEGGGPIRAGLVLTVGQRERNTGGIDDGDRDFWHLRGGFGTSQPLDAVAENLAYRFEIFGQYTSSRLPHAEEFYLGDRQFLRGYRFGEASGDIGYAGLFELDYTFEMADGPVRQVRPYAFIDFGGIRNLSPAAFEEASRTLVSTGIGASVRFDNRFSLNTYVALPLTSGALTRRHSPAFYLGVTKSW